MDAFSNKKLSKYVRSSEYNNWQDVIHLGVKQLTEYKFAKMGLAKRIIASTKKYGPYYIIMPNVALLHAEPSDDSIKPSLSLMILEKNVEFGFENQEKKSANIIFTLSAPNSNDHIDILKKFANIMQNEKLVELLSSSKTTDEVHKALNIKEK